MNGRIAVPFTLMSLYLAFSLPVFSMVYETSTEVIDEEFHLRQGKYFCAGRFDIWDGKITTFPGLYIISALILPMKACTTYYLRSVSLISSVINLLVMFKIKGIVERNQILAGFEALNLAILPPLYFFAHLYYTDTLSTSAVLGLYYFWLKGSHGKASAWGLCGILMRQTNIVWVAMLFGISTLRIMGNFAKNDVKCGNKKGHKLKSLVPILYQLKPITISILKQLWSYTVLLCAFALFVLYNGSIVVGDKSAHVATLHIPQMFYFSTFVLFFGICFVLPRSLEALHILCQHWLLTSIAIFLGFIIVKYNTLVHPYLLADNRHYTFYIWNRYYGKYGIFKYLMVPVYIFVITSVQRTVKNISIEFKLMYCISLFAVLCLQRLVEVRYFILPFIILRLNIKLRPRILIVEFIYFVVINIITFKIFFKKEIYWESNEHLQRLIW